MKLIISIFSGDSFSFPRENNTRLGGIGNEINNSLPERLPDITEITKIINDAKNDSKQDAINLGITIEDEDFSILHLREISNPSNDEAVENVDDRNDSDSEIETGGQEVEAGYISEYDLNELEDDLNTLTDMEDLNLKDFSGQNKSFDKSSPYMMVKLSNGKQKTVKKSSICWLFSEKQGRLSTDRLLRVKGMSQPKRKMIHQKPTTKRARASKLNISEDETDTEAEYISDKSESSGGEFVVDALTEAISEPTEERKKEIIIEVEKYYSVYYDDQWYLGRILNTNDNECTIKFLMKNLDNFIWPKQEDIQLVNEKFIFYGPIHLVGSNPFQLKRVDLITINKLYRDLKRI